MSSIREEKTTTEQTTGHFKIKNTWFTTTEGPKANVVKYDAFHKLYQGTHSVLQACQVGYRRTLVYKLPLHSQNRPTQRDREIQGQKYMIYNYRRPPWPMLSYMMRSKALSEYSQRLTSLYSWISSSNCAQTTVTQSKQTITSNKRHFNVKKHIIRTTEDPTRKNCWR
jgi:hypothetical protein